jgi:type II secretory pathway pseudopilin PulG
MFSLIITIISIALVAALAVATLYYGGQQFSQGTAKANADQLISAAQQIAGANTLYANANSGLFDANGVTGVTDLVNNQFLSAAPSIPSTVSGSTFDLAGGANTNQITLSVTNANVCTAVAKQSGSVVSTATAPNSASTGKQYDCFGASSPYTFVFNG